MKRSTRFLSKILAAVLHALVADGLFARSGVFQVMPESGLKALEELFRARVDHVSGRQGAAAVRGHGCCEAGSTRASTSTRARRVLSREREDMERARRIHHPHAHLYRSSALLAHSCSVSA
jgi:hypothetical protein